MSAIKRDDAAHAVHNLVAVGFLLAQVVKTAGLDAGSILLLGQMHKANVALTRKLIPLANSLNMAGILADFGASDLAQVVQPDTTLEQ